MSDDIPAGIAMWGHLNILEWFKIMNIINLLKIFICFDNHHPVTDDNVIGYYVMMTWK